MRRLSVVILTGALALTGCSSASKTKAATPASANPALPARSPNSRHG